ncbi:MAG: sigma-70 family RNA polymerase sigma factor [Pyrinomonadaceae bacterium]|nr:sigma-70 family RNA polymerase sigma factor [Pyrinomonadaceae bacterium]
MEDEKQDSRRITLLLHEWKQGKEDAFNELFPYVYDELRRRASAYLRNERQGHTLQTTALVNEAYIKLVDKVGVEWEDRNHFFAIAAQAMRRILVDHARKRKRKKRGDKHENLPLDEARYLVPQEESVDLIALDEALTRLEKFDPRQSRIVELKYFGGMTLDETADVLGVSNVTVKRDWNIAKTWLRQQLSK